MDNRKIGRGHLTEKLLDVLFVCFEKLLRNRTGFVLFSHYNRKCSKNVTVWKGENRWIMSI